MSSSSFLVAPKLQYWLGDDAPVGSDAFEEAVQVLDGYFTLRTENEDAFTGGSFEWFRRGLNTGSDKDRFTGDDITALNFLSISMDRPAVAEILLCRSQEFEMMLKKTSEYTNFWDVDYSELEGDSGEFEELYYALLAIHEVGPTTATKLIGRKRPDLFPIFDSEVKKATGAVNRRPFWRSLHRWLNADGVERLESLRSAVSETGNTVIREVSILRVFDVLAWVAGKGEGTRASLLRIHSAKSPGAAN